jgi:hypothetical protein
MQTDLPVRIAYLILAYDQPNHVGRLVEQLDDGNAKFFIHVDRKSDIEPFRSAVNSQRAVFLDERLAINWGGWRMVQATLHLLRRAHGEAPSDYYQLLSDSCYPIKSNLDIANKLRGNNLDYLTINHELIPGAKHFGWVGRYHSPDLLPAREPKSAGRFFSRLQKHFPQRRGPRGLRLYKGWQWWCLRHECIEYILRSIDSAPDIERFFRYTRIPDETFFHTIIGNSKFARTLSPGFETGTTTGNHYVRWIDGRPCVLTADDFDTLIKSKACFARKLRERESFELIAMLRDFCQTQHAAT